MGSGEYVPLKSFQFDGASWKLRAGGGGRGFPTHGVAMVTSLLGLSLLRLPTNL